MSHAAKVVLAIDPGSSKCGLAIVKRFSSEQLELLWHKVIPTTELEKSFDEGLHQNPFEMVIVGGATKSREIVQRLRDHFPSIGILVISEEDTSIQARERYWEHYPRRGWRRFVPASLQVPPEPYDDFAALVLAERVLLG